MDKLKDLANKVSHSSSGGSSNQAGNTNTGATGTTGTTNAGAAGQKEDYGDKGKYEFCGLSSCMELTCYRSRLHREAYRLHAEPRDQREDHRRRSRLLREADWVGQAASFACGGHWLTSMPHTGRISRTSTPTRPLRHPVMGAGLIGGGNHR